MLHAGVGGGPRLVLAKLPCVIFDTAVKVASEETQVCVSVQML